MRTKNRKQRLNKWLPLIVLVVLLILLGVGLSLHRKSSDNTTIPSTSPLNSLSGKSGTSSTNSTSNKTTSQTNQSSKQQSNNPPAGGTLITPYGNFISNHHPGGNNPTSEASICNTTAGATCYIQFTKGDTVKKLDPRTTDSNGAAYWYWDVKSAGLDAGSWTVTAIATLNGETKTAADQQPLVVQ